MSIGSNIFGGLIEGVNTYIIDKGQPTEPKQVPKQFPNQDKLKKDIKVKIFGINAKTFGLTVVSIVGASILAVILYEQINKYQ